MKHILNNLIGMYYNVRYGKAAIAFDTNDVYVFRSKNEAVNSGMFVELSPERAVVNVDKLFQAKAAPRSIISHVVSIVLVMAIFLSLIVFTTQPAQAAQQASGTMADCLPSAMHHSPSAYLSQLLAGGFRAYANKTGSVILMGYIASCYNRILYVQYHGGSFVTHFFPRARDGMNGGQTNSAAQAYIQAQIRSGGYKPVAPNQFNQLSPYAATISRIVMAALFPVVIIPAPNSCTMQQLQSAGSANCNSTQG